MCACLLSIKLLICCSGGHCGVQIFCLTMGTFYISEEEFIVEWHNVVLKDQVASELTPLSLKGIPSKRSFMGPVHMNGM